MLHRLLCLAPLFLCFVGCKKEAPPAPDVAKPEKPAVSKPTEPTPAPKTTAKPTEQPDSVPDKALPAKENKPQPPQRVIASPELAADLRAEAQAQPDNRLVVLGQSNLPAETKLEIAISSQTLEKPLRASVAIRPDGTFRTSPLGSKEGLANGNYTIRVEISPVHFQPSKVRSQFSNKDENLRGPTIDGPMGPVTGVEFEFQK